MSRDIVSMLRDKTKLQLQIFVELETKRLGTA